MTAENEHLKEQVETLQKAYFKHKNEQEEVDYERMKAMLNECIRENEEKDNEIKRLKEELILAKKGKK